MNVVYCKYEKLHWARYSWFQPYKVFSVIFSMIKERWLYSGTYFTMSYMLVSS